MALNFPDSPTLNQIYTDSTSGFSYQWNGTVWISYSSSTASNISQLDNISSSFNGVTTSFALTVASASVSPVNDAQLIISVGGVMQDPTQDYYISGSNIIFTTAPVAGLTFFGTLLGTALPLNTIADGSVTPSKLSTGGPSWNTGGDVVITGTGTTALLVEGNARVTGILTVGTSSITLNGTSNIINVGTGVTINGTTGNISATSFSGDGVVITGVATLTDLRLSSIADKTTIVSGNSVSLVYNTGGGNVAICTNPSGPITLNVTGIPTDSSFDNRAISFAVIVQQSTTAYGCTNVSLNGVAFGANATVGVQTHISYVSGTVATGSTTGYDVFNFTGINTTGSASTTTNYKLLSNVSGGYRRY